MCQGSGGRFSTLGSSYVETEESEWGAMEEGWRYPASTSSHTSSYPNGRGETAFRASRSLLEDIGITLWLPAFLTCKMKADISNTWPHNDPRVSKGG